MKQANKRNTKTKSLKPLSQLLASSSAAAFWPFLYPHAPVLHHFFFRQSLECFGEVLISRIKPRQTAARLAPGQRVREALRCDETPCSEPGPSQVLDGGCEPPPWPSWCPAVSPAVFIISGRERHRAQRWCAQRCVTSAIPSRSTKRCEPETRSSAGQTGSLVLTARGG